MSFRQISVHEHSSLDLVQKFYPQQSLKCDGGFQKIISQIDLLHFHHELGNNTEPLDAMDNGRCLFPMICPSCTRIEEE